MANMLMLGQMGLSLASGAIRLGQQKTEYEMQKAVQSYRNTMHALNAAQNQNTNTLNEISVRDASIAQGTDIQEQSMRDQGAAHVAAAAAGAKGNSVELTMRELVSSAAKAQKTRLDNLKSQFIASNQTRRNVEVARIMGKDVSVIPQPSIAGSLLGMSKSMLDIWDSNQPTGDQISDGWDQIGDRLWKD